MNDLYFFENGAYNFQNGMDPILEIELKKCKTQEERNEVVDAYRTTMILGFVIATVLGILFCGVVSLLAK